MRIKEIRFTFDNFEIITIPENVIGHFSISGIHQEIRKVGRGSIEKLTFADHLHIELFSEGNIQYCFMSGVPERYRKLVRIGRFDDITSVLVTYEDGSVEEYHLPWIPSDLGRNTLQKSCFSALGNLYLVIDKDNKSLNDFFDNVEINNEQLVARRKKDLGIGEGEEEEHELSENDLPDMYRYVFLKDQYSGGNAIAVRVYDEEAGWKFVFANKYEIVNIPTNWQYVDSDLAEALNHPGEEFCIEKIKAKYPPES